MGATSGVLADGALPLMTTCVTGAEAEWFQGLFRRAWSLLPEAARHELRAYWQTRTVPIWRLATWQGLRDHQPCASLHAIKTLPSCGQAGHVLSFSAPALAAMGEALAAKAICHELAHALLYSRDDKDHWSPLVGYGETTSPIYQAAEASVDRLLREWGMDQADLLQWRDQWEAEKAASRGPADP